MHEIEQNNKIQLFDEKTIRTVWDDENEKWWFCVVDVVAALTDSANPKDYLKKMKQRDSELNKGWGQIVTPLPFQTAGGKQKINFFRHRRHFANNPINPVTKSRTVQAMDGASCKRSS